MIVVVGSRHDQVALALVDHWRARGAALLTCEDLSSRGWRYEVQRPEAAIAVVQEQAVPCVAIRGVVTRRPFVLAAELQHVAEADREYVAAEQTAFLVAWLSSLACPVLNRPVGVWLSGPSWRPVRWRREARASGFALATPEDSTDSFDVHVIGGICVGSSDERVLHPAFDLARRAGVDWLRISLVDRSDGPRFVRADATTNPASPALREHVLDFFGLGRS